MLTVVIDERNFIVTHQPDIPERSVGGLQIAKVVIMCARLGITDVHPDELLARSIADRSKHKHYSLHHLYPKHEYGSVWSSDNLVEFPASVSTHIGFDSPLWAAHLAALISPTNTTASLSVPTGFLLISSASI